MNEDSKILKCVCCDYTSSKMYNIKRHMMCKHVQQNVNPLQQNVNFNIENKNILFECEDCDKVFNKQWVLTRHKKICNGVTNPLLCTLCNKTFASRQSKYKHVKLCTIKQEKILTI